MLISSIRQSDSVVYVFFFMFFSIMFCHRILNIVPCLLTFLVLLWSLPFDFPFFSLSIYICYTSSCHNKGIDRGVTQTCVQIQALPFFPVLLLLSHVWLCDPVNCSQPGPFVCGIPQVRILEWVAIVTLGKLPTFPQLCYIPGVIMKSFSYLFSPLYCVYESRGDLSALKGSILIFLNIWEIKFIVVQSLSCVQLFATPWTAPCQASLSSTVSWGLLRFMSTELVAVSNHLSCCFLLKIFPSVRVFPTELALNIKWPNNWNVSFGFSPSSEYSRLISFRIDWLDLLAVQGTLKSLLQYHSFGGSTVLWCLAFFMVQLSYLHMTTGETITLTIYRESSVYM